MQVQSAISDAVSKLRVEVKQEEEKLRVKDESLLREVRTVLVYRSKRPYLCLSVCLSGD